MSTEEHREQESRKQERRPINADLDKLREWTAERRDYDVITGATPPPIPEPKSKQEKKTQPEQ